MLDPNEPEQGYDENLPGNYPPEEDIYRKGLIDPSVDPEDISRHKKSDKTEGHRFNEKPYADDLIGDDLDVPGSEDDDDQEDIGSEDEENNYYSLGGDNHE